MPAIATARKRLERGIKRIEKTGWCQGSLRCQRWDDEVQRYKPISQAKVCLLGALITDQEARSELVIPALGKAGVSAALDAVFEGMRDLERDAYNTHLDRPEEGREELGSYLVTWNDNLPMDGGRDRVLGVLRGGLERLSGKKK